MATQPTDGVVDSLTLRFVGEESDGTALHELRAAHVAEVLRGVVELSSDFAKAGAFGDGPVASEVLVRPAREGSFEIEILRIIQDNQEAIAAGAAAMGVPTLGKVIWWASRSARAEPSEAEYLENGNVMVSWQDNTVEEIPRPAWEELNKRKRRRKKQLREIMAPLSDQRVASLDVQIPPVVDVEPEDETVPPSPDTSPTEVFTLTTPDYQAIQPDDEIHESEVIFETEAQMSAIDFDNPSRWRVKTKDVNRTVTVEDKDFLGRVANGFAIRQTDIFRLKVREHTIEKDERTRSTWSVLKVESHRRGVHDGDT